MTGPWPGRRSRVVALGTAATVGAMVCVRVARDGSQPYGSDGAEYIEHGARLAILQGLRTSESVDPWQIFVASDASFPPLMHLLALPIGDLLGHDASAAAATALPWLLLLAVAVGWTTAAVLARPSAGAAAAAATMLVPALHGMATRYYYDLPMTALLWSAVAVIAASGERRPVVAGLGSGLLLFAAATTKWAALAFGPPMLLGALLVGWPTGAERLQGRRILCGLLCAVVCGGLCLAFVHGRAGDNSFSRMGQVAFVEGAPSDWEEGAAPSAVSGAIDRLSERALSLRVEDWLFYPARLLTSVFSPVLAALLALLLLAWALSSRAGLALVVLTLAGHTAFLLGVMPVLDDRFAVVGAPVLIVAATCGWLALPGGLRSLTATAVVTVGIGVAADLHFGVHAPWNQELDVLIVDRDDHPPTIARGLGAASSVEARGWVRGDDVADHRQALRDATWAAVLGCAAEGLGVESERPMISPDGDLEWVRYRSLLERLAGTGTAPEVGSVCRPEGDWEHDVPLQLVLVQRGARLPSCLGRAGWRTALRVADPDGGRGVDLWARPGVCTAAAP